MKDESVNLGGPAAGATNAASLPAAVDRAAFQADLDALRVREKAHTREGDAIASARRRLPMVEVDASLALTGPRGPLTLLEAFEGRRQLIAYYFMWWAGHPAAEQCEGCTWVTTRDGGLGVSAGAQAGPAVGWTSMPSRQPAAWLAIAGQEPALTDAELRVARLVVTCSAWPSPTGRR